MDNVGNTITPKQKVKSVEQISEISVSFENTSNINQTFEKWHLEFMVKMHIKKWF